MVIYDNYKKALDSFISRSSDKSVNLFAVLKMDELIDKWSVLLAADWITEDNRKENFNLLADVLTKTLDDKEIYEIARVGVFGTNFHLAELFLEKFQTGQHIKEDAQINGNVIHEGYILICEKTVNTNQTELIR